MGCLLCYRRRFFQSFLQQHIVTKLFRSYARLNHLVGIEKFSTK